MSEVDADEGRRMLIHIVRWIGKTHVAFRGLERHLEEQTEGHGRDIAACWGKMTG